MASRARVGTAILAAVGIAGAAVQADAQSASATRAIVFKFTPTGRAQIAIWIEQPDGTFLATVALTQAVSVRGIGNRPGATQMNSGFHWPYGRREGVLPIWGHRRAAAPGAQQFPRIVFQNRPEGYASRYCEDSTPDSYFCLPFSGDTRKTGLDAISCASPFNSDKGRILTQKDVDAGYAEPALFGSQSTMHHLPLYSLYPPRRDVSSCTVDLADAMCVPGGARACNDSPDLAGYSETDSATGETTVHVGFVTTARAVMPDIDAVTMATPPGDQDQAVMFSVPDSWPLGGYVAWLEVNTEGDYNGTFSDVSYPTPLGPDWDSWAMSNGYPYRGQPSVVFSAPFTLGASASSSVSVPVGYGSVDGIEPDAADMHVMDGSITDDPASSPGSGADRLRMPPGAAARMEIEVRDQDFCRSHEPPAAPTGLTAAPVSDPKHSHEWGHLHFVVPASELPIAKYDVRMSKVPIVEGDPVSFIQGLPALAATAAGEALMVPTTAAAGSAVDVDFGGLNASTDYWIAVRAVDVCNRPGPHTVAQLRTTKVDYTKLSGCFVATAAWGSALAPEVASLRRARDRLRRESTIAAIATNLYYQSGPAAAEILSHSDVAKALARRLLAPIGVVADAAAP